MFEQPIVERKSTSPLATSLLVLSAVFLLGATVFVGAQINGLRHGTESPTASADQWAKKNQTAVVAQIEKVVGKAGEKSE